MLKAVNIHKSYGNNAVLKGIDLSVGKGEIYGLIGANGSGKTTLFNIIAQVLNYNEGEVLFRGEKVTALAQLSQKVGYIIDIPALYEYMTANEYMEFLYSPKEKTPAERKARIAEVLALVDLSSSANKRISAFSRGMKQRMGIAAGLVFDPELVLLDEPSSALDPKGRLQVINIIKNLKQQGKTIILSTHILNDIEKICDRIGFLVDGKIAIEGSLAEILEKYAFNTISVLAPKNDLEKLQDGLADFKTELGASLMIEYKDKKEKATILQIIANQKLDWTEISNKGKNLDEIFVLLNAGGIK